MRGQIRIEREFGIVDATNKKPIFIPAEAEFSAADQSKVLAIVKTCAPSIIEAGSNSVIVEASQVKNFSNILVGSTDLSFRQSYSSSDPSPGKPEGTYDWKQASLRAIPVAPFKVG